MSVNVALLGHWNYLYSWSFIYLNVKTNYQLINKLIDYAFLQFPTYKSSSHAMDLGSKNQNNSDHPLSITFPGFTSVNRRRRITCRKCDLPFGYAGIDQAHLDSENLPLPLECQFNSGEQNCQRVVIPRPINIHVNPKRLGSHEVPDSGNAYMTWVLKNAEGNLLNADEIQCDGCGRSVGVRITTFESHPPTNDIQPCQPINEKEVKSHYYCFSIERVNIEPLFGNMGTKELSSIYYGGECYFNEIEAIEDSDIHSNNSKSWMRPLERVIKKNNSREEMPNSSWPVMLDLLRQNELPDWTLN